MSAGRAHRSDSVTLTVAASIVGLRTTTIKSWRRRFGLFGCQQTGVGHHVRFDADDVASLRLIAALSSYCLTVIEAANVVRILREQQLLVPGAIVFVWRVASGSEWRVTRIPPKGEVLFVMILPLHAAYFELEGTTP